MVYGAECWMRSSRRHNRHDAIFTGRRTNNRRYAILALVCCDLRPLRLLLVLLFEMTMLLMAASVWRSEWTTNTLVIYMEWMSEWASYSLLGHFGDECLQAIDCTGTDNQKQGNKTLYVHQKHERETKKTLPQTNEALVCLVRLLLLFIYYAKAAIKT